MSNELVNFFGACISGLFHGLTGCAFKEEKPYGVRHKLPNGKVITVAIDSWLPAEVVTGRPDFLERYRKEPNSVWSNRIRSQLEALDKHSDETLGLMYGLVRGNLFGVGYYAPYYFKVWDKVVAERPTGRIIPDSQLVKSRRCNTSHAKGYAYTITNIEVPS